MAKLSELSTLVNVGLSTFQHFNSDIKNHLNNGRNAKSVELNKELNEKETELNEYTTELNDKRQRKERIDDTIRVEEKKIERWEYIDNNENKRFIVAIGHTGEGKSTILNRLYGDTEEMGSGEPFRSHGIFNSVTQVLNHIEHKIDDTNCILVDTPGYSDTNGEEKDNLHFNNLENYLYSCGGVDSFLLIINGTNLRIDQHIQEMLEKYERFFGANFWQYVIIILTHVESYVKRQYEERIVDNNNNNNNNRARQRRRLNNGNSSRDERNNYNDNNNNTLSVSDALRQELRNRFNFIDNDCYLPVIPIGFDNYGHYNLFCTQVINEVNGIYNRLHQKFQCDHIISPIIQLREDATRLQNEIDNLQINIDSVQETVDTLSNQIREIQNKIDNPEPFPLITNISAQI